LSARLEIAEIHTDDDLRALLQRIPPSTEPVLATLAHELNDQTDAVILQRQNRNEWEMPYLAVINCRGWHGYRRYFSAWHEVVHLFLDGNQLTFAFRKTNTRKKHPEEVLVDKIAGEVAFHRPMFQPIFRQEIERVGRLTFEVIERVRAEIAPDASRLSALHACLRHCPPPVYFLSANLGYKRAEERQLNDLLSAITDEDNAPQPRLRVVDASSSPAAQALAIRIHERMAVPPTSVVSLAFEDASRSTHTAVERLDAWTTSSSGPIGTGPVEVEAVRSGKDVWALVRFLPDARAIRKPGSRRH
jgi:hypothetical protein